MIVCDKCKKAEAKNYTFKVLTDGNVVRKSLSLDLCEGCYFTFDEHFRTLTIPNEPKETPKETPK